VHFWLLIVFQIFMPKKYLPSLLCLLICFYTSNGQNLLLQVDSFQKISDTKGGLNVGLKNEDWFGLSIANLGDVNGDKVPDLAVTAQGHDGGSTNEGGVYICFMNKQGTVDSSQLIAEGKGGFKGSLDTFDQFGISVEGIGDLNQDGVPDMAVGAYYDDDGRVNAGAVYIIFLNKDGTVKRQQKISRTSGSLGVSLGFNDRFGISIANIGDLNKDGHTDIAVGAHFDDDGGKDRGAVYILFLDSSGTVKKNYKISSTNGSFRGSLSNGDVFGYYITDMGNYRKTKYHEIAVGAMRTDDGKTDAGAVWGLILDSTGVVGEYKISALSSSFSQDLDANDRFGRAMVAIPDRNNDGKKELLVSAINDDDGGTDAGAFYMISHDTSTVFCKEKLSERNGIPNISIDNNDVFGVDLEKADFNGDGFYEIIVGAKHDDDGGKDRGAIYVLFNNSYKMGITNTEDSLCQGKALELKALAPNFTNWYNSSFKRFSTKASQKINVSKSDTIIYFEASETGSECIYRDTLSIYITPTQSLGLADEYSSCGTDAVLIKPDTSYRFQSYSWSPAAMVSAKDSAQTFVELNGSKNFELTITDNNNCQWNERILVNTATSGGCKGACDIDLNFQVVYGGNKSDGGHMVYETSDSMLLIIGATESYGQGGKDILIMKTDYRGRIFWSKTYGGNRKDEPSFIIETNNGDFVLTGFTQSYGGSDDDFYIFRINKRGKLLWTKFIGGSGSDKAWGVKELSNGDLVISGHTESYSSNSYFDMMFLKISADGKTITNARRYGSQYNEGMGPIDIAWNGKLILFGNTPSSTATDPIFMELNSDGTIDWLKTYSGNKADGFLAMTKTSDKKYVMVGRTESYGSGKTDFLVTKLAQSGYPIWTKAFGGSDVDEAHTVVETPDKGFLILGTTKSVGNGGRDMLLTKIDSAGKLIWAKAYGGPKDDNHSRKANSLLITKQNKIIFTGYLNVNNDDQIAFFSADLNGNTYSKFEKDVSISSSNANMTYGSISLNNSTASITSGSGGVEDSVSSITATYTTDTFCVKFSYTQKCLSDTFYFTNQSINDSARIWSVYDSSTMEIIRTDTSNTPMFILAHGVYYVNLLSSNGTDTVHFSRKISHLPIDKYLINSPDAVCKNAAFSIEITTDSNSFIFWNKVGNYLSIKKNLNLKGDTVIPFFVYDSTEMCRYRDTLSIRVGNYPVFNLDSVVTKCPQDTFTANLSSNNNYSYNWSSTNYISDTSIAQPNIWEPFSDVYYIQVSDTSVVANGCSITDSITINVIDTPNISPPALRCISSTGSSILELNSKDTTNHPLLRRFNLYRINVSQTTLIKSLSALNGQSIYDSTAINYANTAYAYFIKAENSCGFEGISSDTITNLNVDTTKQNDRLYKISWNNVYSASNPFYRIYVQKASSTNLLDSNRNLRLFINRCNINSNIIIEQYDTLLGCTSKSADFSLTYSDANAPLSTINYNLSVKNHSENELEFLPSNSSDVEKYYIYASKSGGNYGLIDSIDRVSTTRYQYDHTSIASGSSYYDYKVSALDSCSNESPTSPFFRSIQLDGIDKDTTIVLTWNQFNGYPIDQYIIETYNGSSWTQLVAKTANDTAYTVNNIICNQQYFYRIKGIEKSGSRITYSDSVMVLHLDTIAPVRPKINYVSTIDSQNIAINIAKSYDNDLYRYRVYVSKNGGPFVVFDSLDQFVGNDTTIIHKTTDASENYCYKVSAIDFCVFNESKKSKAFCNLTLALNVDGCKPQIDLSWNQYDDWGSSKYEVWRAEKGQAFSKYTTTNATSYSDISVLNHKIYRYKILAISSSVIPDSAWSNISEGEIFTPDSVTITSASVLESDFSNGKIEITWNKASSQRYISHFVLDHKTSAAANFSTLSSNIPIGSTTYLHENTNTKTENHFYRLTMVDSCNNEYTDIEQHKTIDLNLTKGQLRHNLSWNAYKGFKVKSYEIEEIVGNNVVKLDTVSALTLNWTRYPAPCNVSLRYRIAANGVNGQLAYSDTMGIVAFDSIPSNAPTFTNASVISNNSIEINFTGADSLDLFAYAVYRSKNGKIYNRVSNYIPFTNPAEKIEYIDTVATNASAFYYKIEAIDSCVNRTPSSIFRTTQLSGTTAHLSTQINWTPFEGYVIDTYKVLVNNGLNWDTINSTTDTFISYANLPCNGTLAYQVIGFEKGNKRQTSSDTLILTPRDLTQPQKPLLHAASITNNDIEIRWQQKDLDVLDHIIQIRTNNSTWRLFDTLKLMAPKFDNSLTLKGLYPSDSQYFVRILSTDSCANNNSVYSDSIATMQLNAKAGNLRSALNWFAYQADLPNSTSSQIVQEFINGKWLDYNSVNSSDTNYTDSIARACNITLAYRIKNTYSFTDLNGQTKTDSAFSDSVNVTPFDTIKPNTIQFVNASVNLNNQVTLKWNNGSNDVKYNEIYRYSTLGPLPAKKLAIVVNDTFYIDRFVNGNDSLYQYYVKSIDSCNANNISIASDTVRVSNIGLVTGACEPQIELFWAEYINNEYPIDSYYVFRKATTSDFSKIAAIDVETFYFNDTTVLENENYCYRLQGFNGIDTVYGDSVCLTPFRYTDPDTSQMSFVTILNTDTQFGSAQITWQQYAGADTFARGYRLYSVDSIKTSPKLIYENNNLSDTSYILDSIDTETHAKSYYVSTFNLCNVEGHVFSKHRSTYLRVNNQNLQSVLSWQPYLGEGITSYQLLRSEDAKPFKTLITLNNTDSNYIDTTIRCGHKYAYYLKTQLQNSTVSNSNIQSIVAYDTLAAGVPKLLNASIIETAEAGKIQIQWIGDDTKNRKGFKVYHRLNKEIFQEVIEVENTSTDTITIEIENLKTDTGQHWFRMASIDSCGNVSDSSLAIVPLYLTTKAGSKSVILNWKHFIGWTSREYTVQRKKLGSKWRNLATLSQGTTTYTDSKWVNCDTTYFYRIITKSSNGLISYSNEVEVSGKDNKVPSQASFKYSSIVSQSGNQFEYELIWYGFDDDDIEHVIIQSTEDTNTTWSSIEISSTSLRHNMSLNYNEKPWFFRILLKDSCGNIGNASKVHSPPHLWDSSLNQSIAIAWSHYIGGDSLTYYIYRDDNLLDSTKSNSYVDSPLTCTSTYQYQVVAKGKGFDSKSNIESNTAKDNTAPKLPIMAWAGINPTNDSIELSMVWPNDFDVKGFNVYREDGSKLNSAILEDSVYLFANQDSISTCYYVTSEDQCENESEKSLTSCTMILKVKNDLANKMEWNPYQLWFDGVFEYQIFRNEDNEKWELISTTNGSITQIEDTVIQKFESSQNVCYRVKAIAVDHPEYSGAFSSTDCLSNTPIFYIPNAFTPDNNNLNENFGPYGMFVKSFEMQIFSRTGQNVFSTQNSEYWDGSIGNGETAPLDSYLYLIKLEGHNGESHELTGYVNVIR
jgi:hypothetical protein